MLCLEGSDILGKTTAASFLVSEINRLGEHLLGKIEYNHYGSEVAQSQYDFYSFCIKKHYYAVVDRLIISELAYSFAIGRKLSINKELMNELLTRQASDGGITIVFAMEPNEYSDWLNFQKKRCEDDEEFGLEIMLNANTYYWNLINKSSKEHNEKRGIIPIIIKYEDGKTQWPEPKFLTGIAKDYIFRKISHATTL